MEVFEEYLASIPDSEHRKRVAEVLQHIIDTFPSLEPRIAWNQPMFIDHGTYIIGFSVAKQHMSVAPELAGIQWFAEELKQAGFDHTKLLFRIRWNQEMNYPLLDRIIEYNQIDKAGYTAFWRK